MFASDLARVVCASPDYLAKNGMPRTPADLARHDAIVFASSGAAQREWQFGASGTRRAQTIGLRSRFAVNSADAAIQYAEAGGGLTRVLAYQAADALKRGRLRIVLPQFELPALPINIVYPTSRLLSAKVRTFIDLVVETSDWNFG